MKPRTSHPNIKHTNNRPLTKRRPLTADDIETMPTTPNSVKLTMIIRGDTKVLFDAYRNHHAGLTPSYSQMAEALTALGLTAWAEKHIPIITATEATRLALTRLHRDRNI